MTLGEIIEYTDRVKPNAFGAADKVMWLNELENSMRADVFMEKLNGGQNHIWSGTWRGTGIEFQDENTVMIPGKLKVGAGGKITLSGLSDYAENNGEVTVKDAVFSDEGSIITTEEEFAQTGETGETASATAAYDGSTETMTAPEEWSRIYYTYLEARIAAANGEWTEYANSLALHNQFVNEYMAWVSRNFADTKEYAG